MNTLYIGMNDKDAHMQLHPQEFFIQAIAAEMDCTILPCMGVYKGEIENSLEIKNFDKTHAECVEIARRLCVILNQESIIVNGEFITAA